jgi:uncharacterized membrane protein HdeD (DUF308 family)
MATASPSQTRTFRPIDEASRGWQIGWGVLLIIAGILAVSMPAVAALATAVVFAWLLILGGCFEIAHTIQTRAAPGFAWRLISGILTLLLGLAILILPGAGVASLALLVSAFLLLGGLARTALAWRMRPERGWGWVMFDGLLSILLAILITLGWPATSLVIIGMLTGFSLVSNGVWRIMLARASATP